MDIEWIRSYCLSKKGTDESFPFDDTTLVIKVGGKIFILISLEGDVSMNLKCDPALAIELREAHPAISPGYHMNKKHWNTIIVTGQVPDDELKDLIRLSYNLVNDN